VRPELTVGPYFVDKQLDRADIRVEPTTGKRVEGVPLALTINVSRVSGGTCGPLPGAMVDVWHSDAHGVYSGVNDAMSGNDPSGQKILRGYQVTDAKGAARFTTIYPERRCVCAGTLCWKGQTRYSERQRRDLPGLRRSAVARRRAGRGWLSRDVRHRARSGERGDGPPRSERWPA
jgi:hypothetical protein